MICPVSPTWPPISAIERSLVEDQQPFLSLFDFIGELSIDDDPDEGAFQSIVLVPFELGRFVGPGEIVEEILVELLRGGLMGFARFFFRLFFELLEAGKIDR